MKTIQLSKISLAMALGITILVSCGKDDDAPAVITLPPIGGYASANEVGAADLLAYWPLNGNGTESKSNTAPSTAVGASYEAGAKGQGLKLVDGYLKYPNIPALITTNSLTLSLWSKVNNNALPGVGGIGNVDGYATMLFQMTREASAGVNDWIGAYNLLLETGQNRATTDSLAVKAIFRFQPTVGGHWGGGDCVHKTKVNAADILDGQNANPNKNAGKWVHLVYIFDSAKGLNQLYANGEKISVTKFELQNGGNAISGTIMSPSYAVIGTYGSLLTGGSETWQRNMTGNVDEIRIWKKALNPADINALYKLEKAGR